ncbi:MAG: PQQ-binding-like beta-propeller repeat protein, partial [Gemmataceae bacterium]
MPTRTHLALATLLLALGVPLLPGPRRAAADRLPDAVRPTWTRDEPPLEPTWPDQPRFTSDAAPRPVPAGDLVLFTSSRHDTLTAADALTGATRWRFTADGPIRFAPAVWRDRAFAVSDDGRLYCLALDDGSVLWTVRGGPADHLALGNERLVSLWPARGAPAVADDGDDATVYFGAGVWPFMGIFLHAVDARTGEARWTNSGDGSTFIKQPHNTDAFAGVAPQGTLVVQGDRLLVPGGRSVPACYDRHTGRRLHYRLAEGSKNGGGPDVVADGAYYLNGGGAFDLETGLPAGAIAEPAAAADGHLFSVQAGRCRAFVAPPRKEKVEEKAKGKVKPLPEAWLGPASASVAVPPTLVLLAEGGRVYGAGPGVVYALEGMTEGRPHVAWRARFRGTAAHVAYHDGSLFVGTREGSVHAFGPGSDQDAEPPEVTPLPATPAAAARAAGLLAATGVKAGYAVVSGFDAADVGALLGASSLNLIVLEPDAAKRAALREALREADVSGKRAAVLPSGPADAVLPPYLCALLAIDGPADDALRARLMRAVRPYGGVLAVRDGAGWKVTRRDGAPPGAGNWTHQNVDAANTRVATDALVKAPLGVLWYGGPGNQDILPRHGHGPVPQVVDGRCIVEGMDQLRAIDIYTGRLLWTASLPGLGQLYDNTAHQAGANAVGSNYVSTPEGVFVALGRECLRLDPETGRTVRRYQLPKLPGEKEAPRWAFLNVAGGYLIGGSSPAPRSAAARKKGEFTGLEASRRVTVLDRDGGQVLWGATAAFGFRHNGICAGGGRLYLLDRKPTDPKV